MSEKKTIVPLVSDEAIIVMSETLRTKVQRFDLGSEAEEFEEADRQDIRVAGISEGMDLCREIYENDRAASRGTIEKLTLALDSAMLLANEALLASLHPGSQMNIDVCNDLLDRYRQTITEARAFLNKNVKP